MELSGQNVESGGGLKLFSVLVKVRSLVSLYDRQEIPWAYSTTSSPQGANHGGAYSVLWRRQFASRRSSNNGLLCAFCRR